MQTHHAVYADLFANILYLTMQAVTGLDTSPEASAKAPDFIFCVICYWKQGIGRLSLRAQHGRIAGINESTGEKRKGILKLSTRWFESAEQQHKAQARVGNDITFIMSETTNRP